MVKNEEMTHAAEPAAAPDTDAQPAADSGIPLVAMILGIVSLATFMLFLGIPAIILGIIGLKKYQANRAFSITGIVTGAISTLIMLGLILIVAISVMAAVSQGPVDHRPYSDEHRPYDSGEYRMERGGREGA